MNLVLIVTNLYMNTYITLILSYGSSTIFYPIHLTSYIFSTSERLFLSLITLSILTPSFSYPRKNSLVFSTTTYKIHIEIDL